MTLQQSNKDVGVGACILKSVTVPCLNSSHNQKLAKTPAGDRITLKIAVVKMHSKWSFGLVRSAVALNLN